MAYSLLQTNRLKNKKIVGTGINIRQYAPDLIDEIKLQFQLTNDYIAFELAHHYHELNHLSKEKKIF